MCLLTVLLALRGAALGVSVQPGLALGCCAGALLPLSLLSCLRRARKEAGEGGRSASTQGAKERSGSLCAVAVMALAQEGGVLGGKGVAARSHWLAPHQVQVEGLLLAGSLLD